LKQAHNIVSALETMTISREIKSVRSRRFEDVIRNYFRSALCGS